MSTRSFKPLRPAPTSAKPWEHAKEGEGSGTDPFAASFVESLSFDTRLYAADIRGSLAHARMLVSAKLISREDYAAIERGLSQIIREIESASAGATAVGVPGAWPGWKVELEDVHMCIESALINKVGEAGRKLHTGRSRNDQVALDLRLWLREACANLAKKLEALMDAFAAIARDQGEIVLTSYTHMQRAQPIVVGAECMAWWAMFARDQRLLSSMPTWEDGLSASPLGSGAVAGSTLPLDRAQTAQDLGFTGPSLSSIDSTASRDEALDFLHACSRSALHLSRLAEQWIIYCTTEFGFLKLGEAFTTGSSMMPQKRNPDMLELIRGKAGTIIGHQLALTTIVKGLPLAYNRDLQEDKRHVFAAFDTLNQCLEMAARIVQSVKFQEDAITKSLEAAGGHADATVLAEYLVAKGVPFRTAHQIVGQLVRICDKTKRHSLSLLDSEEIEEACRALGQSVSIGQDVFDHLGSRNVVKRYRSAGHAGSSPGGYKDWLNRLGSFAPTPASRPRVEAKVVPTRTKPSAEPSTSEANGLFGPDPKTNGKPSGFESLIEQYKKLGRTLDDLPYTSEFERLIKAAREAHPKMTPREVFHKLQNLRKAGKLPKVGKSQTLPVKLSVKEEGWLQERVIADAGSLGQRDQLPFTESFDRIVEEFNAHHGRELQAHAIWRLMAKLAK